MAVNYETVNYPFLGGLDETKSPELLEDGFTIVENGSYEETGKIRKRPGVAAKTTAAFAVATGGTSRLIKHKDAIIRLDKGDFNVFRTVTSEWTASGFAGDSVSNCTVRRMAMDRTINSRLTDAEVAVIGNWTIHVWQGRIANEITCHVLDRNGTFERSFQVATNGNEVRIAKGGSGVDYLIIVYGIAGSGDIRCRRLALNGATPTLGAEVVLVTDANATKVFDITPDTSGWLLYYRTTTDTASCYLVTVVPALGALVRTDAGAITTNLAVLLVDGEVFRMFRRVNDIIYIVDTRAGASVLAETTLHAGAAAAQGGMTLVRTAANQAMFMWTVVNTATTPYITYNRKGTNAGVMTTRRDYGRIIPITKLWLVTDSVAGAQGFYALVHTGEAEPGRCVCLVEFTDEGSRQPRFVASMNPAGTPLITRDNLAWVSQDGSTQDFHMGLTGQSRPGTLDCADHVRIRFFSDTVTADGFDWAESGDLTYWASGSVQYTGGESPAEISFAQPPHITATVSAGGAVVVGSYQFVGVYEWFDRWGNYHQSAPSAVVSATTTGGNQTITIDSWHCTLTNRQKSTSDPAIQLAVYIADTAGIFYRQYPINAFTGGSNNPNALVFFSDPIATAIPTTSNATLYTTGNVLEQDHVYGGATSLCRHKSRLFCCGGEEPDVIWYSQEETDGRPMEFNLAQQIRIPGEELRAVASLDDSLIAFGRDKIYAILGEGPNATGDPQSGGFSFVQIPSDSGLVAPRSVLSTPMGVFYQGRQGMMLLDRSRSVKFIGGAVLDTLATYSDVYGGTFVAHRGEVRWIARQPSATPSRVIVYDTDADKWSIWKYDTETGATQPLERDALYAGGIWYTCNNGGRLMAEDPASPVYQDNGVNYALSVQTGQVGFGDWLGLKRLRRVRVLMDLEVGLGVTADLQLEIGRNGCDISTQSLSADYETHSWTSVELDALAEPYGGVRAHVQRPKGHRWQFKLKESTSNSNRVAFIGLAFEVGRRAGVQRSPAADTK